MRFFRLASAVALLALVSGCGALSSLSDASRPLEVYELRAPQISASAGRLRNVELVVEEPSASGALATERIMIRPGPLQAQYVPGVRWADPAPAMLQTLLLRSLTATDAFGSVGRRPIGTVGDYALLSELTDFQAEITEDGEAATIRLRLIVRLVREGDARVIATRTFTATEPSASVEPETLVPAFDRATARLFAEMEPWIVARLGAGG